MNNSRNRGIVALAAVLILGAVPAVLAQTQPPPPPYPVPQASGAPRPLQGTAQPAVPEVQPAEPEGSTPNVEGITGTTVRARPGILGRYGAAGITVSALGDVEGPPTGTLDLVNGGLGEDLWSGSDRAAVEDIMARLPLDTPVAAVRALARRIALTRAATPVGTAPQAFMTVRIRKLLEAGLVDDAANLAAMADIRNDPGFARIQAESLLFAGRGDRVCTDDKTATRLSSAEPFWIELRAYCYAMSGDNDALALTRAVMDAQNLDDDAFDTLLDDVRNHTAKNPGNIAAPTALHAFLLGQAGLPVGYDTGAQLGTPGLLLAMRNADNPPDDRLKAAEQALRTGAASPQDLAAVADAQHFTDDRFATERVEVQQLPFLAGQALLRQAVAHAAADAKPALIYEALNRAEAAGLLPVAAALQHDALAQVKPTRDMRAMADLMGRALLIAGDADAASRWYDILDFNLPADKPPIAKFQLVLNLVASNPARQMQAQQALGELAKEATAPGPDQAFAALALDLTVALQDPMPPDAQTAATAIAGKEWPGRSPAANLNTHLSKAMKDGRKGEALMLILTVIGTRGPGDLAPDVTVALVRDLMGEGVPDAAREIATAALLLYTPAPQPVASTPPPQ